ncbi:hypothetical protein [Catellatospora tritici]|uniref:hypothetical protein n=1 Tax=Catellatospora tritici TaxID=2851566 RepID=UPI001C2CCFE9|nr:hypothetical protein [Catellatospora tritici]MBV1855574.1 hypothetical protein [Catellatospora tritici]
MDMAEPSAAVRQWLARAWSAATRVALLAGGEDAPPVANRPVLARVDDPVALDRLRRLTTTGTFAGDVCRCPGDLTIALYGEDGALLGAATVHGDRLSWERGRFGDDLVLADPVRLELYFSELGIRGTARALLGWMISALDLDEGEIQFRPAGDVAAMAANRVPAALSAQLLNLSGPAAGDAAEDTVDRLFDRLRRSVPDHAVAARALLGWLGSTTWPGEALSGDGLLARRLLARLDPAVVVGQFPTLVEAPEVMGALVFAAFADDDVALLAGLRPAIVGILAPIR